MIKDFIKQNDFVKEYSLENYSDYEQVIRNKVGYIKVNLDFPALLFMDECISLFDKRKPFTYTRHQELPDAPGWAGVILADNGKPRATPMSEAPKLVEWFKSHECFDFSDKDKTRIHIHYLEPKSFIPIHQDYENDMCNGLNFAITQPAGCKFYVEGYGVIPFSQPGDVYLCQIGKRHCVYNDSDEIRIHILPKGPYLDKQKILKYINP